MDMKNETDAELIREAVLKRIKDMGSPGFLGTACQVAGMTVSMKEGEDRALAAEGVWSLRFVGKGTPPLDTLTALFRKPEPRTDFVFRNTSHMEIPDDSGFKPVERYGMEVYRTFEPEDTGWKVAFLVSEATRKDAEFKYVNYSDSRGVKSSGTRTVLSFSNPTRAMTLLAQFGDFITGKMKDDEWGDEYQSGFRDIVGRVQGMLAEKRHPGVVFHTRDTLELYQEGKADDIVYKATLKRDISEKGCCWVLSITPVETTMTVGTPEAHADLVKRRRAGEETQDFVLSECLFAGKAYFTMAIDFMVQSVREVLKESGMDKDGADRTMSSLVRVQTIVKKGFLDNRPFHEIEGRYVDGEEDA